MLQLIQNGGNIRKQGGQSTRSDAFEEIELESGEPNKKRSETLILRKDTPLLTQ